MGYDYDYHKMMSNRPQFVFPSQQVEDDQQNIDQVIQSVKDVVTDVIQSFTTEEIPAVTESAITTKMESAIVTTMASVEIQTSATVTEMLNNSSVIDAMVNSSVAEVVTEAIDNSDSLVTSATTQLIDWMGNSEEEYNLTMIHHHAANYDDENTTLYIILGVILGILFAIGLILLMIYISYKRSNLYSMQMQSHVSSHSRSVEQQEQHNKGADEVELAMDYDKSGYKF
ncbi:PREDICTED: uncharacterized protein LOC108569015 isoform X1 [Nicrophorus vespilloides]|uniref:Uncharacterized protein LOC108569015 isoform X1 n=1 Tax=Nicrophorus vespilloides TaxID=110193 RepID=A0ABM1NGD4_NICVS|nr:PREDICTED: uncharacterized protein LOC108569015 isoform X1 [Nicrophorus vespilloides]